MKTSVLKKSMALGLILLCLAVCLTLPLSAAESERVYDPAKMLNDTEAAELTALLNRLSAEHGVEMYLATYLAKGPYDDFYGDDYCHRMKDIEDTDAVLLVVTYERLNDTYYYDIYTYGEANYDINQKEVNYILDDYDVHNNLKGGHVYDGCEAFFTLTAEAFTGRVGRHHLLLGGYFGGYRLRCPRGGDRGLPQEEGLGGLPPGPLRQAGVDP